MTRLSLGVMLLHLPVFVVIGHFNQTGLITATVLWGLSIAGPLYAQWTLPDRRQISMVHGFAYMCLGGALVHIGQGPMQIEMHFYFFAVIASLSIFANPAVVTVAAATVTVHHLLLWLLFPRSVFFYDAPIWIVLVHALFVVLSSIASVYFARTYLDNVVGLEKIIHERTDALNARNADMKMLLDSVEQGFFTLDRGGRISDERSAAATRLLGPIDQGETLEQVFGRITPLTGEMFALSWEDLLEGMMPAEVCLAQLPAKLSVGPRHLSLSYTLLGTEEDWERILVVVTDVTVAVARARMEAEQRELMVVVRKMSTDKLGFIEFLTECDRLIALVGDMNMDSTHQLRRWIHTLKGNTAMYGLERFSEACHQLESRIDESGVLSQEDRVGLVGAWDNERTQLGRLVGDTQAGIELNDAEYEGILQDVLARRSHTELAARIVAWRLEATQARLSRIADQTAALAERLGKTGVEVVIEDHGLRLDPEQWGPFWSTFVHAIRNAVDHGLESASIRQASGKPGTGRITLRTVVRDDDLCIEVSDDGQGIDWDRLTEKARRIGLPAQSRDDLIAALFTSGVSTRDAVSTTSGRGVGMSALKSITEEYSGTIEIESARGVGTTMRFRFPGDVVALSAPITSGAA